MNIEYTRLARRDLNDRVTFLFHRNPTAAGAFVGALIDLVERLAAREFEGPPVVLRTGQQVHRWPLPPMVVYYQRLPTGLRVLRVYHGVRRPIER